MESLEATQSKIIKKLKSTETFMIIKIINSIK